jgi:hypothetical protein
VANNSCLFSRNVYVEHLDRFGLSKLIDEFTVCVTSWRLRKRSIPTWDTESRCV